MPEKKILPDRRIGVKTTRNGSKAICRIQTAFHLTTHLFHFSSGWGATGASFAMDVSKILKSRGQVLLEPRLRLRFLATLQKTMCVRLWGNVANIQA